MSDYILAIIFIAIVLIVRVISILLHNTKIIFHKKLK